MAIRKTIRYFVIAFVIVSIGIVMRVRTTLPLLDEFRFKHSLFSEDWNNLADALWEAQGLSWVTISKELEVVAFSDQSAPDDSNPDVPGQVLLRADQKQVFGDLLRSSRLYRLQKWSSHLRRIVGDADRFGRVFLVHLISPRDDYQHYQSCDEQYRSAEEGFCEVAIGDQWILEYQWVLPYE